MRMRRLASVDAALSFLAARGARRLVADSRRVRPGDAFVAWPGHAVDARRFVAAALDAGAAACLVEAAGAAPFGLVDAGADETATAAVAGLHGLKAVAGEIAAGFLGHPSRSLAVLAVTGTNGKTSTAWWLAQALGALGRRCGVIGTLGVGEPPRAGGTSATAQVVPTGLTTPDPVTLQTALRGLADAGFAACAIEASSIGIAEHRLAGTRIELAVFTNFTQDHLDYHGSMDDYWAAKARLFRWPGLHAAIVNVDDARGRELARSLAVPEAPALWTCAVRHGGDAAPAARLVGCGLRHGDGGLVFDVVEDGVRRPLRTRLIGDFNVANVLGVVAALRSLGVAADEAVRACEALSPVPGRMQRVGGGDDDGGPQVVVDYAHTPDALDKALRALAPWARGRGGALWCVFGCGGNRDAAKRPLMGEVAARLADRVVVTSDNPRDEPPEAIVAQVADGAAGGPARVERVVDRAQAIERALAGADARDVVLIAGKGHEDYQEIAGVRRPFSDAALAAALLRRAARPATAAEPSP